MHDPRSKNESPKASSASEYLIAYARRVEQALAAVPRERVDQAFALLKDTLAKGRRIYVAGNGGSSAIADHLCCDWMKGTYLPGKPTLKTHSLSSNTAVLTALANDWGYDQAFSGQIEMLGESGDVLVLISSSGNSPNILKAAEVARKMGLQVIGLSGFSGGKLLELSNVAIHVPVNNYGMVEDAHQSIMHALAQFLAQERDMPSAGERAP